MFDDAPSAPLANLSVQILGLSGSWETLYVDACCDAFPALRGLHMKGIYSGVGRPVGMSVSLRAGVSTRLGLGPDGRIGMWGVDGDVHSEEVRLDEGLAERFGVVGQAWRDAKYPTDGRERGEEAVKAAEIPLRAVLEEVAAFAIRWHFAPHPPSHGKEEMVNLTQGLAALAWVSTGRQPDVRVGLRGSSVGSLMTHQGNREDRNAKNLLSACMETLGMDLGKESHAASSHDQAFPCIRDAYEMARVGGAALSSLEFLDLEVRAQAMVERVLAANPSKALRKRLRTYGGGLFG